MAEILLPLLFLALAAVLWFAPLVLSILALRRASRLDEITRRLGELERSVRWDEVPVTVPEADAIRPTCRPEPVAIAPSRILARTRPPIDWEWLIGRRALGWIAAVSIVFAAAFFVRYAFENQWIGPIGRIALAACAGAALVVGGWHYHRRGWPVFSTMLTGAGTVLCYLAVYSAFGFYMLLPRQAAAAFLVVIVLESMGLAVLYDRMPLALVAILGGLATPVLMRSEHDQYAALFVYLAALDLGVLVLALRRNWPAIATAALLGTHVLFWSWYGAHYHPEKRPAAISLQLVVLALFLGQGLLLYVARRRPVDAEGLARWLATPFLAFLALYLLLRPDRGAWMGTLAVSYAVLYAALARLMLAAQPVSDDRLFLASLSIAVGFVAMAFPIQADASWIALGWAAEAAMLWWFGQRLAAPSVRILAAGLIVLAWGRMLFFDTPSLPRPPFVPILNRYALPSLGVMALLFAALVSTRRFVSERRSTERGLVVAAGICGVVLIGAVLSIDLFSYCDMRAASEGTDKARWERIGEVTLSVLWATYATLVLAAGFALRRAWLRWTALGWYTLTLGKVFLVDLAGLGELYRVLAFFILAIALGLGARAYQGIRPNAISAGADGGGGR
jgi:uncharacterized membrane protein